MTTTGEVVAWVISGESGQEHDRRWVFEESEIHQNECELKGCGWATVTTTALVPESLLLDARAALNGERFQHDITKRELENAAESWVDDDGTVWDPPTAWAYAQVCRVEKEQRQRAERAETLAAELEKDARRYRWFRDPENYPDHDWWSNVAAYCDDGQSFDAAIDAAIDARAAGSEGK